MHVAHFAGVQRHDAGAAVAPPGNPDAMAMPACSARFNSEPCVPSQVLVTPLFRNVTVTAAAGAGSSAAGG
ncbi:MAG: hypothetical protein WDM96_13465, partial [Lacunisphaera sp.]